MDEATLAAELLADKFNTQSQEQTQFSQLQHIQTQSQITTTTAADYSGSGYPQATNGNAAASGHGEVSNEPVQAYAKLEGESFCYYIRTLQVTFGRKASSSDQVDIHLGPTKAISRQHARLFYNFTTQRFEMMVFGKNGAFVNDQFVEKGVTVPLENRTKIQIGEVSFSFLLPKLETDETTQDSAYGEGSSQKNGSQRHGNHNTINTDINSTSGSMSGGNEFPRTPTEQFDSSEYSSKDTKPPFSYASLIAQAINSTPSRKLTLNGIYQHITNHYPYYQLAQNGWQNSIRHNLSLNKAFVKVPRSDSEPGKGAFWTIDQSCENQFANGVYKRNRRAISSKPGGGRARSDSESPMDQPDKPRKRVNTGTEVSVQDSPQHQHIDSSISQQQQQQQQQTQPQTGQQQSLQTTMAQKPPVANAGLNLANPLQEAPGLSALNLAALTQTITAAAKEGNQAALASALIAAANASGIPGGLAASLPATARALAAHLQQQQLLQQQQQQQQQAQQSSSSNSQTQPNQASVTTPITTPITTSSQPATTTSISAGLQINNGQANLTSTTSNQSETVVSTSVSLPSTSVTSTPTLAIPTPAASAQGTPSSVLESISTSDSSGLSNSASTINDPSTQQSPIAQLVAAAQAQARAQALSKQQQEGKVENQQTTQTPTTIVQDTITSTNPSPTSKPTTLPEEKASDSIAESDT